MGASPIKIRFFIYRDVRQKNCRLGERDQRIACREIAVLPKRLIRSDLQR